jgi:hypothetical protein
MLAGKSYKLRSPTLGLTSANGKRRAVLIPAGSQVSVVASRLSPENRMVDVMFDGERLTVFAVDILDRGEEIQDG